MLKPIKYNFKLKLKKKFEQEVFSLAMNEWQTKTDPSVAALNAVEELMVTITSNN